jgi:DNA helicase-2/ATP-dependent DNA helicase PcrA
MRALGDHRELEEERRLAYVGITRARHQLYLSRAVTRGARGQPQYNPASRFLEELPEQLVRWERTQAAYTSWGASNGGVGARNSFAGGTERAARLAERLGVSAAGLATASDLPAVPVVAPGDRVNHQRYGLGRVLAVRGTGPARRRGRLGDQGWIAL